jgi:hypothetical protein
MGTIPPPIPRLLPQTGTIRCEDPACRRAALVTATPAAEPGGPVFALLAPPCCPACDRPFGPLRWHQWLRALLAEGVLRRQAAEQKAPLPDAILERAAAIRASWDDPEVLAAHLRAMDNDAARFRARVRREASHRGRYSARRRKVN